jgi:heterodisulfide reductase subunit C
MMYEFRITELAEEFGVHRNTIRNWINSGTLPAQEGPGKRYAMKVSDYVALCDKFGVIPKVGMDMAAEVEELKTVQAAQTEHAVIQVDEKNKTLYSDPSWADVCLTCGTCASACPIAGVNGLDPRKIVRMAVLGLEDELVKRDWPWKCTMCGKCEEACPMNVEIVQLMRRIRSRRPRNLVPGPIHKGVTMCLERGNNLGIPKDDFVALLHDIGEELAEEACPGFKTPLDVRGARLLVQINSKEPFAEPEDMKWWWKIFYAANESWTISSENWEGVNWGLFSGDDEAMKTIVGRIVDNMQRLGCEALLLPE